MFQKYQTDAKIRTTSKGFSLLVCPKCERYNQPESELECDDCGAEIELIAGVQIDQEGEVTVEQLRGEYRQLQDTREMLSRLENRVALPNQVSSLRKLNSELESLQGAIHSTIENMEGEE